MHNRPYVISPRRGDELHAVNHPPRGYTSTRVYIFNDVRARARG